MIVIVFEPTPFLLVGERSVSVPVTSQDIVGRPCPGFNLCTVGTLRRRVDQLKVWAMVVYRVRERDEGRITKRGTKVGVRRRVGKGFLSGVTRGPSGSGDNRFSKFLYFLWTEVFCVFQRSTFSY